MALFHGSLSHTIATVNTVITPRIWQRIQKSALA
jgi:hypothetical protein